MHLSAMSTGNHSLRLEQRDGEWLLAGAGSERFGLVNEYLSYLADRNYSPRTVRAYGFDLLAFCRWLSAEQVELAAVTTDALLRFLAACRQATVPGRPGPNVVSLGGRRLDQYAAATINHRLIAISGMFAFRGMRDPDAPSPVPKGREARRASTGERNGLLARVARRPKTRSALRLREPRRLPRALDLREAAELLASFHAWRDRAIAGLMLYCGLRSAEVLGMNVTPWLSRPGSGDTFWSLSRSWWRSATQVQASRFRADSVRLSVPQPVKNNSQDLWIDGNDADVLGLGGEAKTSPRPRRQLQVMVICRSKFTYPARWNARAIGTFPRSVAARILGTSCAARILVPSASSSSM